MADQIAVSMYCSTVCSGADQRKHQISASLAFVRWIDFRPSHDVNNHSIATVLAEYPCFSKQTKGWFAAIKAGIVRNNQIVHCQVVWIYFDVSEYYSWVHCHQYEFTVIDGLYTTCSTTWKIALIHVFHHKYCKILISLKYTVYVMESKYGNAIDSASCK